MSVEVRFEFTSDIPARAGTLAELPIGIDTKAHLLIELAERLSFPDYFGHNWDALQECITDLAWLPAGPVTVVHRDLPLADGSAHQKIYLGLLDDAVQKWHASGQRDFAVVFPPEVASQVAAMVELAGRDASPADPDWRPFTYRDFYDVPRIVVVRVGNNVVLLDCAFDEATSHHQHHYDVFLLPPGLDLSGSWIDLRSKATRAMGTVPVEQVRFDPTLRASIDLESLRGSCADLGRLDELRGAGG